MRTRGTTKTEKVRQHLLAGRSITPIEALDEYGSFRLSSIIKTLRDRGYAIRTEMVAYPDTGSRFARYSLINQ